MYSVFCGGSINTKLIQTHSKPEVFTFLYLFSIYFAVNLDIIIVYYVYCCCTKKNKEAVARLTYTIWTKMMGHLLIHCFF